MNGIFVGYAETERCDRALFAGANTGRGFRSSYDEIFREGVTAERLYILKGGAGTGKSTFMRKAATEAVKRGYTAEFYVCGSDPDSLDAVVLDDRIVIADGTAPHVLEMQYPGTVSGIIDPAHWLDSEKLKEHKEEILKLTTDKAAQYRSAYRFLAAAEILDGEMDEIISRNLDHDRLRLWTERKAKSMCGREVQKKLTGFPCRKNRYVCGITMKGKISLRTLIDSAETVYGIRDDYGAAAVLLEKLGASLYERGLSVVYGRLPVSEKIRDLYIPEIGTVFTAGGTSGSVKTIHMSRFLKEEQYGQDKKRLKELLKIRNEMTDQACICLGKAGEAHFALEKIHVSAMDFRGLNRSCSQALNGIMEKLTTN